MMMHIVLILEVCVICLMSPVEARCEDVSVRNTVTDLIHNIRGCTKIVGYLEIALFENTTITSFQNISFPELVEITGFFLLFRVYGLTSIGRLFPNLTVIRGLTLYKDYSFVIYDVKDLEEIGMYSLKYIARGSTRIERCGRLCYTYTINWEKIGGPFHELHYFNTSKEQELCESCPGRCKGNCWNLHHCQEITSSSECHTECIGCKAANDPGKCLACRSLNNTGTCVSKCPERKLVYKISATCITRTECQNMYPNTWWIIDDECSNTCPPGYMRPKQNGPKNCIKCKGYCPKICQGAEIDSVSSAELFHGCTIINGSLSLKINSKSVVQELEKNLALIETIVGYLKVYRSSRLTTLQFFKNLKLIKGNELVNKRHALAVYENLRLHKLWDSSKSKLKIKKGSVMFHYNSQLCLSEIEKWANLIGVNYETFEISPYLNGDKRECNQIDLHINVTKLTSTNITLEWEQFVTTDEKQTVIGYFIYYVEDPYYNMTPYIGQDECYENFWKSIFILNKTTQQIVDLNPYTQYSYYIKSYSTTPLRDGQTRLRHFKTLSTDPSEPEGVKAFSTSSNSINLSWDVPLFPNGKLDHYKIALYLIHDDEMFVSYRNYCNYQHSYTEQIITPTTMQTKILHNESCCKPKDNKNLTNIKFDVNCALSLSDIKGGIHKNYIYSTIQDDESTDGFSFVLHDNHTIFKRSTTEIREYPTNSSDVMQETIPGHLTAFVLKDLKHFSLYSIYIQACNEQDEEEQCSSTKVVSQRTMPKESADDIPSNVIVDVDRFNVTLRWLEPTDPNAFIVSYQIEHQRVDVEHSKTLTECLTRQEFIKYGKKFQMKNFLPGKYFLRVRAVSLAGPGKFTKHINFEIMVSFQSPIIIVIFIIIAILALIILGIFYCYRYYIKKKGFESQRLISSGSLEYTGPIYVEDEWEMDRDDVKICSEIGQGGFGMVYTGFIKSHNRPCAIKTINQQASIHEKMNFLNEASVMKSFSNAYHVVKLLGVVSKGQQPLVIMELMVRGDLKSFLRDKRSCLNKLTCAEIYRMAAEIADGMLYLAAKKFVHRDLAARNCMVSADHTVKIGDFGMAKDIYQMDYYRNNTGGLMPVRWMAPESLADGVFTTDSDVWSYGILLWEIATYSELPYQGLTNEQVLQFVIAKGTLDRPSDCPDLIYLLMVACWKWQPSLRPTFTDIVEKLESHVGHNFRFVSFYHGSEGAEYRMNAGERTYNVPALSLQINKNTAIYWNAFDDDISI